MYQVSSIKYQVLILVLVVTVFALSAGQVLAHVSVKPAEVGVGAFQTFTMGVPNEKDNPTVALRLVIPEGLEHVSPNVKPGWNIQMKHAESTGSMEDDSMGMHDEAVTEISWTGGSIPAGQRDDFLFSAKVPAEETQLMWKAYQTYSDGTVVSWDLSAEEQPKDENGDNDFSTSGPYSVTKIINDLKKSTDDSKMMSEGGKSVDLPLLVSIAAIAISGASFVMVWKKR